MGRFIMEENMVENVSVIITCYNHEKYIEQCMESVFNQTYRNIKLLVIDDGSTDQSAIIIEKLLGKSPFPDTSFIKQENKGVCLTRNTGLEWNDSEFVLFIDSDNFLESNYIEAMLHQAQTTHTDIVYCDLYDFESGKNFISSHDFELGEFLKNNFIDNCSLIRSSVIKQARYDEYLNRKFLVDYDFLLQLILKNHAIPSYCRETRLNYRVLQDSISRKDGHQNLEYYYDVYTYIMHKYLNSHPEIVYQAVKDNLFVISNRLTDLVNLHFDLEKYIEELKTRDVENLKSIKELNSKNSVLEVGLEDKNQIINRLHTENQAILHSKSYRLGNAVMKPAYLLNRFIHNPKLVLKVVSRGKNYIARHARRFSHTSKYVYRLQKDFSRSKSQLSKSKRYLIFVIFENQKELQEYKFLFIDHLSKFADKTLIISNCELSPDDLRHLKRYGDVHVRENQGYDTAAFRYGILQAYPELKEDYTELILANDTCIGPISDFAPMFEKMDVQKLDFWGITFGEEQEDITGYNRYNYIPKHLQSYFLAIKRNMFLDSKFIEYWEALTETNSRDEAIGRHETVFTRYFADLGYRYDAYVHENKDSAMYIHPLTMIKLGVPLIKYSALSNYDDDQFVWQGLIRQSEVPALLEYVEQNSNYPVRLLNNIIEDIKHQPHQEYILIIDGVQNVIPQCTRYRVLNKKEYLEQNGYNVKVVNLSEFQLKDARYATQVIIYRAPYSAILSEMIQIVHKKGVQVYFDIDDLVIDTKYTNQLEYTQGLSSIEKQQYDASVDNYGKMMLLCDGVITSTNKLVDELKNYKRRVLLDRNVASNELVRISNNALKSKITQDKVRIGYFSGSITHNENFNLIKADIIKLMNNFPNVELHLVGHIDLPEEFKSFKNRVVTHDYVDWTELPALIAKVNINLAPLKESIFNEAKSEIKWIEAALVDVVTVASDIGAFHDLILDGVTGVLCKDNEWYEKLDEVVSNSNYRNEISKKAHQFVLQHCTTKSYISEINQLISKEDN